MAIKAESELLKLLARRENELHPEVKGWSDDKARAVALHSEANKGDPFAGPRMALHLRQGYDTAGEVIKAANALLASSRARAMDVA